jgi:hypothetical protein
MKTEEQQAVEYFNQWNRGKNRAYRVNRRAIFDECMQKHGWVFGDALALIQLEESYEYGKSFVGNAPDNLLS